MIDRSGQQLGNYRLIRLLGRGGFADVYLGEHCYLQSQAAIKILHTQILQETIGKFLQEARILARLRNPHIVLVYDFSQDSTDGTHFLVMDYAPHGSIRDLHPRGSTVPPATVVSYIQQIADALQQAHNEHIVHRDLKPENLLLGRNKEIILSDFGIATVAESTASWRTQGIAGTPYYMAPEQFRGKPQPASDQYALGVLVYEWLSGSPPFTEGDFIQLGFQHTFEPVPPLRNKVATLSPEVEQVVMKALAKDAQQRFESVRAFAAALEEAYKQEEAKRSVWTIGGKTKEQWAAEGYEYHKTQRYKEAIEAYSHAIELDPNYVIAYINRGFAYIELKEYRKAIADLDRAIALDPVNAFAYNNRGYAYIGLNDYQKAITDSDASIKINPRNANAYDTRGSAYLHLKQYPQAIADFDQALALDPHLAIAYYNRGNAYLGLKQYQRAVADFDHALALDPKLAVYNNRGYAYIELKQYQRAIADFDHALALDPNNADAYNNRGYAYTEIGEYRKGVADCSRALEINPRHAYAYDSRGYAYYHLKEYRKAIADFDRAILLDPGNAIAYYNRANTYRDLQQYQQALHDYDRALALDPSNALARTTREEVYQLSRGKG